MFNPLNLISKFIKSNNQKELDRIGKIVEKINLIENKYKSLEVSDFPKKTDEFKQQLRSGKSLNEILPEAFALVREASLRIRNERHFDVQLIGGVILHENKIAEMRTGEGKTLTITLAAYLNALDEKGVHIVTVNDYLAKRDSLEMGQIYNFLGLTSGYINNDQDDLQRKKNYDCDITYATNSELGFDYLRDNMKFSEKEMVQREHFYAIVDEIDSCLIDEARTPLVISGAADDKTHQYLAIDTLVRQLNSNDYEIDEKEKILDTGGFKGQSRELEPNEFYNKLEDAFGVPRSLCINMYGMTELSSQFYDDGNLICPSVKCGPHWMRSRVVNPITGETLPDGQIGILAHTDLAHFNICTTILTEDAGLAVENGFQLIGRADGAEAQGCSMAVDEFLKAAGSC